MRIDRPFIKLPLAFDAGALAKEVAALPDEAWTGHPSNYEGNSYVPLVTPSGIITNEFAGPMGPTPHLAAMPYLRQVFAALDCVRGRSRLMGLSAGGEVPLHVDTNYYWRTHVRMHIPIVTNPGVAFTCGDETVHMAAGECWVFDTFRAHRVLNDGDERRVHLVADTIGGERLWDLIDAARGGAATETIGPQAGRERPLRFETNNYPAVMSPWEMRGLIGEILDVAEDQPPLADVRRRLDRLIAGWAAAWTEHGEAPGGLAAYRMLVATTRQDLNAIGGHRLKLGNGVVLYRALQETVFENAVESDRVRASKDAARAAAGAW